MLTKLEVGQRCSEITRSQEMNSGGTAIRADLFLAVDVPLPWPKPVFNHQLLMGVEELLSNHSSPVRLVASVPENNNELTLTAYTLNESSLSRKHWAFNPPDLPALLEGILGGQAIEDFIEVPQEEQKREIWICTQGSHDVCCGSEGTSLAIEVNKHLPKVEIRRVSHLGGHRFAPTAITFPDGRMWSHLDIEDLLEICNRKNIGKGLLKKCRGWCGSEIGKEQVAEREGLNLYGWDWDEYKRRTSVVSEEKSQTKIFVTGIHDEDQSEITFEVLLIESEETPILSCDRAGEPPSKWQKQYEVQEVNKKFD